MLDAVQGGDASKHVGLHHYSGVDKAASADAPSGSNEGQYEAQRRRV